jgi:hypothetical protein
MGFPQPHSLLISSKSFFSIPYLKKQQLVPAGKLYHMCPVPIPFGHPAKQPTNTTTHRLTNPPIGSFNSSFRHCLCRKKKFGLWTFQTSKVSQATVGFTFFPCIVGLVCKNPLYIKCTRYSHNILLIYIKVQ